MALFFEGLMSENLTSVVEEIQETTILQRLAAGGAVERSGSALEGTWVAL